MDEEKGNEPFLDLDFGNTVYLTEEQIRLIRSQVEITGPHKVPEIEIVNQVDDFVSSNGTSDECYKRFHSIVTSLFDASDPSLDYPEKIKGGLFAFFLLSFFEFLCLVHVFDGSEVKVSVNDLSLPGGNGTNNQA